MPFFPPAPPLVTRSHFRWPAGGVSWTPASLPGIRFWCDAGQLVGLADGDPINQWPDLTGNGYNFFSSGTGRPTYKAGIVNGRPVVRFDGVDDFLRQSDGAKLDDITGDCTFFFVYKLNRHFGVEALFQKGDGTALGSKFQLISWWNGDNLGHSDAYVGGSSAGITHADLAAWAYYVRYRSGATHVLRIKGVPSAPVGLAGALNNSPASWASLASTNSGTGWPSQVDIAECGMTDQTLSGGDLTTLESYLATKYAL